MKIISWNVNGIRAIAKKDFYKDVRQMAPDVLCLQETKAQDDQVAEVFASDGTYHVFANSAEKKGYSGTAILSKLEPQHIIKDIGMPEHDREGRVLGLEYDDFFLINVYVPNSGSDFFNFLKQLEEQKPVLVCGDFNVAHKDIDLARPKPNYNKSAGYMQEEIDGMDRYTGDGFTDTFRHLHPDTTGVYSWWSYRAGAREKNVGWRIDYFLASRSLLSSIEDAFILNQVMGSDHCPIGVALNPKEY